MYHGFDWYGRTLEVREASNLKELNPSRANISHRIGMLVCLDPEQASVEVSVAQFAAVSVVGVLEVDSEVATEVDFQDRRVLVEISPKIFMPTTLVLINRRAD